MGVRASATTRALAAFAAVVLTAGLLSQTTGVFPPPAGSGTGLPSGCSAVGDAIQCDGGFISGDGTESSGLVLPELAANGASKIGLYAPGALAASYCHNLPLVDSATGQWLVDAGTVTANTQGDNCTDLVWTSNAPTATALAANPTNCSAGNYPLGVDASGNAENCTAASGGSGLDVSTVGYCWIFTGCLPSGAATHASSALTGVSNNVVYMFQVLIPFTMKPATLRYNASGSGSMAFAFYNDSGSNAPGSKVANTEGTTNSVGTSITVASAATLTPGVYWFGFAVSDNTQGYNKYHPAHSQAFTVIGGAAAAPRAVSCSNAASGGTYAMPATCGTATALTTYDFSLPVFMFLP